MSERLKMERHDKMIRVGEKYTTVAEIVEREQNAWKIKDIPLPPDELFNALEKANEKRWTTLEPHYFPLMKLTDYLLWSRPGIRLEDVYWKKILHGNLPKDAIQLYSMWVLVDYIELYPENSQDGLAPVLCRLRTEGKIEIPDYFRYLNPASRFRISKYELDNVVNPEIAKMIKVQEKMSRQLRLSEFNVISKLHYPRLNYGPQLEWMEDAEEETPNRTFTENGRFVKSNNHFMGGGRSYHGHFTRLFVSDYKSRHSDVAFRSLIVFPTKK